MTPGVYLVIYTLVTGYGHNHAQDFQTLNDAPYENMQLCQTANASDDYPSWKASSYVLHNQETSDMKAMVSCITVSQGENIEQAYHRQVD